MFESTIGLVVGFLLLGIITGWNVICIKDRYLFKISSISILIWYGLIVFYTLPNLMGWAANKDLPANAKIIAVKIIEPKGSNKGVMYFWLNEKPEHKKDAWNLLRPDKIFIYTGLQQPRSYKIPYNRELHKKLIEAKKNQNKNKGSGLFIGEKGIKKNFAGNSKDKEKPPFKIINPFELLSK